MLPLAPWRSSRASSTPEAQVSTLKPGGSLNFAVGSLSAAVGIGNAGTGAIFMAVSVFGRPLAQPGSSAGACWATATPAAQQRGERDERAKLKHGLSPLCCRRPAEARPLSPLWQGSQMATSKTTASSRRAIEGVAGAPTWPRCGCRRSRSSSTPMSAGVSSRARLAQPPAVALAVLLARLGADAAVRPRCASCRRGRPRRGLLAWIGLRLHGPVLVAVRPHRRARRSASCSPPARRRSGRRTVRRRRRSSRRRRARWRSRACAGHALGLRQRAPHRARRPRRRADRRPAGCARRLHDRPGQRRPRRADDQAAVRRGDRRRRQPARRRLVAITGDLVDGSVRRARRRTSRRSPACARGRARSSSPATTSTTRAPTPWVARAAPARPPRAAERARRACDAATRDSSSPASPTSAPATSTAPQASDPQAALAGARPTRRVRVLLAHQPRSAAAAEAAGFDLQLSGHTHGGQFLPWNFLVRLQQPFTAGLHRWRGCGSTRAAAPATGGRRSASARRPRSPCCGSSRPGVAPREAPAPPRGAQPRQRLSRRRDLTIRQVLAGAPAAAHERIRSVFISEAFAQAAPAATAPTGRSAVSAGSAACCRWS